MTNKTEQQAVPVAQSDREAAANWITRSPYEVVKAEAEIIRLGHLDTQGLVQAFARHRLASLPCKSGEGAGEREAVPVDDPDHQYAVVSSNYCHPFLAGAYPTLEAAIRAQAGKPHLWHIYHRLAALTPDATQTREAEEPRLMSDEAKTGERVLVHFTGKGWLTVTWEDPHGDGSYSIWTVDDDKHGPYALRGYREGDDTHWMPLPDAPAALNARGGA